MHVGVQIAGGVTVVIIVYIMSLWILRRDRLVANPSRLRPPKQTTVIMDGYVNSSMLSGTRWSTVNEAAQNYVLLDRSYNRKGGAQFSYTLWVQLRDTSYANLAGKTLFMRGSDRVQRWTKKVVGGAATEGHVTQDVMIKCPRVRFGGGRKADGGALADLSLVVEFNTLTDPDGGRVLIKPNANPIPLANTSPPYEYDQTMRQNLMKLLQDRWAMLTFTFEDGIAINEFENGVVVRFYINDALYNTSGVPGALRQNNGDFMLLPQITPKEPGANNDPIKNATVGNMTHYNYALGLEEVRHAFRRGPPTRPAAVGVGPVGEPLYLSEYNRLDVYNS